VQETQEQVVSDSRSALRSSSPGHSGQQLPEDAQVVTSMIDAKGCDTNSMATIDSNKAAILMLESMNS
jgi:hypothetical protein